MRQSQINRYPCEIEHPLCDRCQVPMWLARIEPDKPDHQKRTFECPACDAVIIEVVKYKGPTGQALTISVVCSSEFTTVTTTTG